MKATMKVLWDAIPELNQDHHIIQERKWNDYIEDAWRMHIDIIDGYSDDTSNM